mgnify:CR=1 FL=1
MFVLQSLNVCLTFSALAYYAPPGHTNNETISDRVDVIEIGPLHRYFGILVFRYVGDFANGILVFRRYLRYFGIAQHLRRRSWGSFTDNGLGKPSWEPL